jgi:cytochrome c oxidase subunit IV
MAEHAHDPHAHDPHHVVPLKIYYGIFGILLLLTGVTVAVAYIDLGRMNTVVALAIACFKAMIVVLFFMHVKYSTRLIKLTVIAGLYWLGILFALTMSDYLTRVMGTFGQQISLR